MDKFHFVANWIAFKMNTNFTSDYTSFSSLGWKSHCPFFSDTVCIILTCMNNSIDLTSVKCLISILITELVFMVPLSEIYERKKYLMALCFIMSPCMHPLHKLSSFYSQREKHCKQVANKTVQFVWLSVPNGTFGTKWLINYGKDVGAFTCL